ncbi:MAG: valine--tRNA ligase, partial [Clostridia bacterium]|nr:valine--tRNA ligase [Clostridia bacterium]
FTPAADNDGRPKFCVVIPPPNVTGQLHMGHALDETLQDILVRYKRMQGFDTLWVPGTDHAGIATQIKVEEHLRKTEGITRYDLGREKFLERVRDWKNNYGSRIISQLQKLGSSCDFTREAFTMSPELSRAVRRVFVSLYNDGLIYRGLRITNVCPRCRTVISDAEIDYKEIDGCFWYIKYPVKGEPDRFVTVATTRPETMLGDTAVAVAPGDPRFADIVGKTLVLPLVGREIPVIEDENVDPEFGTGCVKITPAHDPNDYETGLRHGLENIIVIDSDAKITKEGGAYAGLDRFAAREKIVADLDALGLLLKVEKITHSVGHCYRCGTVLEPVASKQWFVKMKPLAEPAIECVRRGDTSFIPERFSKNYFNWMENIKDWCVSRQLWWGHRIPAFYCADCGEITVSEEDVTVCPKCGSKKMTQDEDVLDTWFSSALWPFTTLGWPDQTEDLRKYYPTSVLVTGYDIITFWVSKMIFMGLKFMGEKPFSHVFIHGLIRDAQGRKMSKSLGNGIDPLEIIDKYGADALRFALATGNSPGNDMRFSTEKIESARNFANKLWNASRFVKMNLTVDKIELPPTSELASEDKWVLDRYNRLVASVTFNLDKYEIGVAISALYDFIWDVYCDWYIELTKARLTEKGTPACETAQKVLLYVLDGVLRLLHPFMPFITEEIWLSLPSRAENDTVMLADYPSADSALDFAEEAVDTEKVIAAIKAIRARRTEMNVPPSRKCRVYIETPYPSAFSDAALPFFERLASASRTEVNSGFDKTPEASGAVRIVTDSAVIFLPMSELVDLERERARIGSEIAKVTGEIARIEGKLSNQGFVSKAPAQVVEAERAKLAKYRQTLEGLQRSLESIN